MVVVRRLVCKGSYHYNSFEDFMILEVQSNQLTQFQSALKDGTPNLPNADSIKSHLHLLYMHQNDNIGLMHVNISKATRN